MYNGLSTPVSTTSGSFPLMGQAFSAPSTISVLTFVRDGEVLAARGAHCKRAGDSRYFCHTGMVIHGSTLLQMTTKPGTADPRQPPYSRRLRKEPSVDFCRSGSLTGLITLS
eukprot:COSAG02_NODE_6468_length_3553_cov_2.112044_6_plen_112_part_00